MDYDDNDLHNQNFHLAGEGSTKFPPVLRPYALPKFDFDDNLQSHLRFDSLVETEVYLGIESNQDNDWIEDFSRGNSGIEFNSGAVEPCSISRRHNVWSEATSSESVEMLLNSVGQEEINACDELGFLTKQMEQSLKKDENTRSKTNDIRSLEIILPSDDTAGNSSEAFVGGITNARVGSADLSDDVFVDNRGDDVTKPGVGDVQIQEDSLLVDELMASTQNSALKKIDSNYEGVQIETDDDSGKKPEDRVLSNEVENQDMERDLAHSTATDAEPINSASNIVTVSEIINSEQPYGNTLKEHLELPRAHSDSKNEFSGANEDEICKDMVINMGGNEPTLLDVPSEALPQFEKNAVEVSNVGGNAEPKIDYVEKACNKGHLESGQRVDSEMLAPNSDYVGFSGDNPTAETQGTTVLAEPTIVSEEGKNSGEAGVSAHNNDISGNEKVTTQIQVLKDCSNRGIDSADKEVGSSLLQHAAISRNDSVSDTAFVGATLASQELGDCVLLPSKDELKIRVDRERIVAVPSAESTHLEENQTGTLAESVLPSSVVSPPQEAGPGSVSEAQDDTPRDTGIVVLLENVVQSLPLENTHRTETISEAQSSVEEVGVECTKELNLSTMLSECTEKKGDVSEAVIISPKKASVDDVILTDVATASEPSTKKDEKLSQSGPLLLGESGDGSCQKVHKGDGGIMEQNIRRLLRESGDDSCQKVKEGNGAILAIEQNIRNIGDSSTDQSVPTSGQKTPSQSKNRVNESAVDSMKQAVSVSKDFDGNTENIQSKSRATKGKRRSKDVASSIRLTGEDSGQILLPLPLSLSPRIAEVSPSSSLPVQLDSKVLESPLTNTQILAAETTRKRAKPTTERKPRRSSSQRKDSTKKDTLAKEITPARQPEKPNNVPMSPGIFHVMQSNEMQPYVHLDGSSSKPYFVLATPTAGLPDLNNSASTSSVFQQPFTDYQQVQLRAQIFVYGALIQGTAPEEAYMISAFGGPDGGKSLWLNTWKAILERLQNQKSIPITPETPLHSRPNTASSSKTVDQVGKQSALQSKTGRSSTKNTQSIVSPMIPLSSPLWSMPTPAGDAVPRGSIIDYQQSLTPIHSFQTPTLRNLHGNNSPWMSQPSFRSPWVASSQPSLPDPSPHFSAFPPTEPVQLTPLKETGVPSKHIVPASPSIDLKGSSSVPKPSEPKSRKRKKNTVTEETGQTVILQPAVFNTPVASVPQATPERLEHDFLQRAVLSEESLTKIKESTKHAEDATALANAAVSHSEEIWSQLEKQKESGFLSDIEATLSSAAVAIAAAAAVSRAAAAAANVASSAALQAKLMAEEGFIINSQGSVSMLTGEGRGNSSSSIITAAREAARQQVAAATAASKRAENMDAIVKAAELAAEAVSQAGKIVAMGDPLSLRELIEAGPEGYWRVPEVSEKSTAISKSIISKSGKGKLTTANEKSFVADEHSKLEKGTERQKSHSISDLTKNIVVVLESDPVSRSSSFNIENTVAIPRENAIKEGSRVEVFKDGDGFRAAWYAADVLSLNDEKACVSFTDIVPSEGSTQLEEWVPLGGEGDGPPRIRCARPVTAMLYEGTRKRRRAAMGDYNWSVGDRVDAWMTNSWWEGVVTEKNKKDETAVTVHFPVQVETSTVKAWHLRPSLFWKDGEWVESSNSQDDPSSHEGDVPKEKRLKLGTPGLDVKGKEKASKGSDTTVTAKPEEFRSLEISENEKVFNIGKSSKNENKPHVTRMVRTGLQKEGSKVVFGVPKPGKKRKFMEVSKHYVADRSRKNTEPTDSSKILKRPTRGLRNDPKINRGLKTGKQQTAFGRTIPSRDNLSGNASENALSSDSTGKIKDSSSLPDGTMRKQGSAEEGSFVFSGVEPSKKVPLSSKSERANKGKLAPAARKLGKIEEESVSAAKSTTEFAEPRRSNRRIQPTSRLLEGLQSSLVIPKFPSFSHDKAPRSHTKTTSRGANPG